jgi:hypothetical protein
MFIAQVSKTGIADNISVIYFENNKTRHYNEELLKMFL